MIAWKDQLNPSQMQNVSSYILSMQGTTPADPKEPQGDLYEAEEVADSTIENTLETKAKDDEVQAASAGS
ncbi:MAG: hypothetical protein U5L96_14725 [Owenweeksia sp.]|nr:hypothetical protein [Owenweeksia sp.]